MSLLQIWDELGADDAGKTQGILRRRIRPESKCDLFVGLQYPGHRRLFLVRVSKQAADTVSQLPRTRGCEMGKIHLPEDPPDKISFWLLLTGRTATWRRAPYDPAPARSRARALGLDDSYQPASSDARPKPSSLPSGSR